MMNQDGDTDGHENSGVGCGLFTDLEISEKSETEITKKAQHDRNNKRKQLIRTDIKDLKEKLLKLTEDSITSKGDNERTAMREMRGYLKDKITTYNMILEAENIERGNEK